MKKTQYRLLLNCIVMKKILFLMLLCIVVLFLSLDLCRLQKNGTVRGNSLSIVTTTSMLADAVKNITGDCAEVHCLMGPGIDPHLYRARESDVHALASADLVIYNGLHLEGKMGQVLEGMNRFTHVVNASNALDKNQLRRADFDELYDPHIWFDVTLWIDIVRFIQKTLINCDRENELLYQKNGDDYVTQLELLHEYITNRIAEVDPSKRILITAHDAFGYFGQCYGFEVVGLQGLSTDCDISTQDIIALANYIVAKRIPTIFVEASIPQRSLRAVQHAVSAQGWSVDLGDELYSDSLGDQASAAVTYIDMVKYNINTIIDSLR